MKQLSKTLEWWPRAGLQENVKREVQNQRGTDENSKPGKGGRQHPSTPHTQISDQLSAGLPAASREPNQQASRHASQGPDPAAGRGHCSGSASSAGVEHSASAVTASASLLGKAGRREGRFSKTSRLKNTAEQASLLLGCFDFKNMPI